MFDCEYEFEDVWISHGEVQHMANFNGIAFIHEDLSDTFFIETLHIIDQFDKTKRVVLNHNDPVEFNRIIFNKIVAQLYADKDLQEAFYDGREQYMVGW